jgi:hypothetical protein
LNPKRGEIVPLPLGTSAVLRPNWVRIVGFVGGLSVKDGESKRTPNCTFSQGVTVHSSCA